MCEYIPQSSNGTATVSCGAAVCDWATNAADVAASVTASISAVAAIPGMDTFSQALFWMAVIFVVSVLLHGLINYVLWPRYLPHVPLPMFLFFPRIEIVLALTGFTGACAACSAAIGANDSRGITSGTLVLWAYPVAFLVRGGAYALMMYNNVT